MTRGGSTVRLVQPWSLPRTTPRTIPNRPRLASTRPGRSRRVAGPWLSVSRVQASGSSARPIGTFSQKIHCQEAPSTTAPPTSGPIAMARPPTAPQAPSASPRRSASHGRGQQGERQRDQHGGPDALHGPRGDQPADAGGERGGRRAEGEQAKAGDEHPAPAVPVAERGAGEQQHRERQRVRVDRPLQAFQRGVQVVPDRRQRGGHHQVVERRHEQGRRGDDEGPYRAAFSRSSPATS